MVSPSPRPTPTVWEHSRSSSRSAPIKVQPGERIRVWVLDAGPNIDSSFHIVGATFDTVFKEGRYELQPGSIRGVGLTSSVASRWGITWLSRTRRTS
jgi:nitrite reductase (NO-forming)